MCTLRRHTLLISLMRYYRTGYFFMKESPLPFKVCSIFQLSIDFCQCFPTFLLPLCSDDFPLLVIVIQRVMYGAAPPEAMLLRSDDEGLDELEEALALADG